MRLLTSDEYRAYRTEILSAYGIEEAVLRTGQPGRRANPRRFRRPICSTRRCIRRAAPAGWSTSNRVCSLNGNAERRAMAAGLTDHVWTLKEWITFPAKFC